MVFGEYIKIYRKLSEFPQRLTNNQLKYLSDVAKDISQVLLASTVIPYFTELDTIEPLIVVSGLGGALAFWRLGMVWIGKVRNG